MHPKDTVPWHRSIRLKLVVAAIAVELCMLGLLLANSYRLLNEALESQTQARIESLAPLLNAALAGYVFQRNHYEIETVLKQLSRTSLTDIPYVAVFDRRGELLAKAGAVDPRHMPHLDTRIQDAIDSHLIYDTQIKLFLLGDEVGTARFGLSLARMVTLRDSVIRQSLLIAAAEILLSLLLLASAGYLITRHVATLLAATRRIARGDHASRIELDSDDEIGLLADNFNTMAAAVEDRVRALRESETRLRAIGDEQETLIENVLVGIVITADGTITRCNRQFFETLGYDSPRELVGQPASVLFASAEDYASFGERVRPQLAAGGNINIEWMLRRHDGAPCWIQIAAKPVATDKHGYRTVWMMADIGERKRSQEALRQAASVFEHATEGIMITDARACIINVNQAFTNITGYPRDEAIGRTPALLASGRHDRQFYEDMWQSIHARGYWRGEVWNRRKDGVIYPELLTISAVRDGDGPVTEYVGIFSDITELKEHQLRLEHLAHYDALTRLPNRVLLGDRLSQAIAQSQRSEQLLAVAYLDLDGFKPVNDTLGHEVGDLLLIEAARRFGECVRAGDTVCRLGGDEFVLLISALDTLDECAQIFERILAAIASPYRLGEHEVRISASIGITLYPLDDSDPDTLLRHADQAMYIAKQSGRGRCHLFDAERDRLVQAHHEARFRIEAALRQDEFVLYYQPKVNMRSGAVIGVEALIRWRHPERGLLAPSEFLPVIEDSEFSVALGQWVTETAVRQIDAWHAAGLRLGMSVNIAARHLQAPDFVERIATLLRSHPAVPPAALELEVLETAALEDIVQVAEIVKACHDLGLRLALDDFGTGYSSLSYLKRLKVDVLKIDQSFVKDLLDDQEDRAIVEGVIGLARVFRREVIAEGVETTDIGVALLGMGCELAQGYGIARPMPAADIPAWVAAWRPDPAWRDAAGPA
ncbi:MAG: EAL domain-containing protein [Sulfurisoma sp.]|nr:EAL domain-containing protein [Sulfurisoma sp.]